MAQAGIGASEACVQRRLARSPSTLSFYSLLSTLYLYSQWIKRKRRAKTCASKQSKQTGKEAEKEKRKRKKKTKAGLPADRPPPTTQASKKSPGEGGRGVQD